MKPDYTNQYLSLIEEVAEDGELTHKAICKLAKWLYDNNTGGGFDTGPYLTVEVRRWMKELGIHTHYPAATGTHILS